MNENQHDRSKVSAMLPGSIIIAALIIGGAMIYTTGVKSTGGSLAQVAGTPSTTHGGGGNVSEVDIDDDVILGDPDAPVTIILFGDYECPFCGKLYTEVEERLRDEYVAKGLARMVFRDFPLDSIHTYARPAAHAAQCAKDQEKYWLYHDTLFERQRELPTLDFVALAGELGLDQKDFRECVESNKYADEVEKDLQDGIAAGVRGTPGNFVNGRALHGAQPYESFKAIIEEELAKVS